MADRPLFIPATPADVPAIMAIERGPGFESLVGRWPAAEHEAEMAKAGSRYFLWSEPGSFHFAHGDPPAGLARTPQPGRKKRIVNGLT